MNYEFLNNIVTGFFSVIITLITVWSKLRLDTHRKEKSRKQDEQITPSDIDSMVEVQRFLDELIQKWDLDRAAIYQFHNGGKFFNGISMKKFSLTYEGISSGIARLKEDSQNVFVTEHPTLIKNINQQDFFYAEANDPSLDYMRHKVEKLGIIQLITVPVRSLTGTLLGFAQYSTIKQKIEITEDLKQDLIDASLKISGYLQD